MKASELKPKEFGYTTLGNHLIIKTDDTYIIAGNYQVKIYDNILDIDVEISGIITNQKYIVQFDESAILISPERLLAFIDTAIINNKDIEHLTITCL